MDFVVHYGKCLIKKMADINAKDKEYIFHVVPQCRCLRFATPLVITSVRGANFNRCINLQLKKMSSADQNSFFYFFDFFFVFTSKIELPHVKKTR